MKTCGSCKIEKSFEFFSKNKKTKDGLNGYCKECERKRRVKYYYNNKEKEQQQKIEYYKNNSDKLKSYSKKYRIENPEKIKKDNIEYRINNVEKLKQKRVEYYNKNKQEINKKQGERLKKRYQFDVIYKLKVNVRNRITAFVNKNGTKTFELIGCSPEFLKHHLENQFTEGMTWENHSTNGWHIDHIKPLSSAKTEEEVIKLCHYTNLKPMWSEDNLRKSDKISEEWNNII